MENQRHHKETPTWELIALKRKFSDTTGTLRRRLLIPTSRQNRARYGAPSSVVRKVASGLTRVLHSKTRRSWHSLLSVSIT